MINHLDNLRRHLFLTQINDITAEAQVRFRPPDENWAVNEKFASADY